MQYLLVLMTGLSLMASTAAAAPRKFASLQDCLSWRAQIERYSELRRGGGAVGEMEQWKRQRNALEQKFRRQNCRWHGRVVR